MYFKYKIHKKKQLNTFKKKKLLQFRGHSAIITFSFQLTIKVKNLITISNSIMKASQ